MSEQNKPTSILSPVELPAKRKRGRPRKDGNLLKKPSPQTPVTSAPECTRKVQNVEVIPQESIGGTMVGRIVTGVIDGTFDAGYFLTVRIGNSGSPLRGVVFQPGSYTPVTVANDVAPQAEMHQRRELLVPGPSPQIQTNGVCSQARKTGNQPVQIEKQLPIALPQMLPSKPELGASFVLNNQSAANIVPATILQKNSSSSFLGGNNSMQQNPDLKFKIQSPPLQNLRMVEQDEVMQVFEIATPSVGSNIDAKAANDVAPKSSLEPKAILSTGHETTNLVTDVQNQAVASRTDPDSFEDHELKQSYLELLQTSLGTNSQALTQKIGTLESQTDNYQLICSTVKSQVLHQPSADSKCQPVHCDPHVKETRHLPGVLVDIELNNPIIELHEIPVVAQTQSVREELQAAGSKLQSSEIVPNEPKSSNVVLQHSSVVVQGTRVIESKLQPCEFVHMELNSSSFELHQTPIVAEDQSVSEEHQEMKLEIQKRDFIQNKAKDSDVQFHPSHLNEKHLSVPAMDAELEQNKLIHKTLRNSNLELHPNVFGESQLLDFIHEPMDFMMERPSSPKQGLLQDVHQEAETMEVRDKETFHNKQMIDVADNIKGCSQSALLTAKETQHKLELAVKDSAPLRLESQILDSAGCTTDMGQPLGRDILLTESHKHSRKPCEEERR